MTRTCVSVALAVTLGLAVTPAGAQPKEAAAARIAPNLLVTGGFDQVPTTACNATNPKAKAGPPVTMDIGEVLKDLTNSGKITRNIKRTLPGGGSQDVNRPADVGARWPTNLDMELAEPKPGGQSNDYVMVTVNLRMVRGVSFLRPVLSVVTDSSIAVMVAPGMGNKFCGRTDISTVPVPGKDYQTLSFGVFSGKDVHSVNIGIMIPDDPKAPTYWLPIILDPNIKNEG